MKGLQLAWSLAKETYAGFNEKNGSLLAGALAFQTVLSIAPLIIIAVAIAGALLGAEAARAEVSRITRSALGPVAATIADNWIESASHSRGLASVVGAILLLLSAASLFSQLKSALNQIWNVGTSAEAPLSVTIKNYVRERLLALLMVLAVGPLLLAVFATRTLLFAFNEALFDFSSTATLVNLIQLLLSIAVVTLISALAFRLVPDGKCSRRSRWWGALVASVLFNLGNVFVGLYLARVATTAVYGAAGTVIVLLVWLEYSAQAFLLGAEFTQVHLRHFGSSRRVARVQQQEASA